MPKVKWSVPKPVFDDAPYLEPGQFAAKWSGRCKECEEFFPKNSAIGYNGCDEIVCADCWTPRY